MLNIINATKKYNDFIAFENVNMTFEKGIIYGLIGYNGAGKTTLLKSICGVFSLEQGRIELDGQDIFDNPQSKAQLFFVPDSPFLPPHASMMSMRKFYREYYPRWNDSLFNSMLKVLKLDANKRLSSFSKGMLRQAFIIFSLSVSVDYLLLDELFDGIDPVMREIVRKIMIKATENGRSIIMTSHNVHDLVNLCSHISILRNKHIIYSVNTKGQFSNEALSLEQLEELFKKEAHTYDISGLFENNNLNDKK